MKPRDVPGATLMVVRAPSGTKLTSLVSEPASVVMATSWAKIRLGTSREPKVRICNASRALEPETKRFRKRISAWPSPVTSRASHEIRFGPSTPRSEK